MNAAGIEPAERSDHTLVLIVDSDSQLDGSLGVPGKAALITA